VAPNKNVSLDNLSRLFYFLNPIIYCK
jgi:hypothetical protein